MTPATVEDVDAICAGLPQTWFGTSWGNVPTWLVRRRPDDQKGLVQLSRIGELPLDELTEIITDAWRDW